MESVIFLAVILVSIAIVAVIYSLFRWVSDYRRPQWRRERWNQWKYRIDEWQAWWAWRPVRTLSNRVVWWTTVYRTVGNDYVDFDDWQWYHYADEFDLLRTKC